MRAGLALLALTIVLLLAPPSSAGSETPPEGPPWKRDLIAAMKEGIAQDKPVFAYLTKTYCPHCVVFEREVLSNAAIEPTFEKAIWLYVFRDFSGSEEDRAAERVAMRLGLSSYPQHFLLDPETLEKLASTGRSVDSFTKAMETVKVGRKMTSAAVSTLQAAEKRAVALEESGSEKAARKALDDADPVVLFRALQILSKKKPEVIVKRADKLLAVPNDLVRYEACAALAEAAALGAADALEALVEKAPNSHNPNVLRMRATQALATCGDASSVAVLMPHATSGAYRNGLTKTAVDALVAIGKRLPKTRKKIAAGLVAGYPEAATSDAEKRMCESLARRVHAALGELTGKRVKFPGTYDAKSRKKLLGSW